VSDSFSLQDLVVGDMVLFYGDPHNKDVSQAAMGWISQRPGVSTANILVWAPTAGFVEKPSVRHVDDPFWKTSDTAPAWAKWGAFELHPNTKALKDIKALLTKQRIEAAKAK